MFLFSSWIKVHIKETEHEVNTKGNSRSPNFFVNNEIASEREKFLSTVSNFATSSCEKEREALGSGNYDGLSSL